MSSTGNVGKGLRTRDQVHVRTAIHHGRCQLLNKLGKCHLKTELRQARRPVTAAENHDGSSPKAFLLVNAELVNFGTVKSRRNERVAAIVKRAILLLRFCEAREDAANAPEPSSASEAPAKTINRRLKTRRLKKAD